MEFKSADSVCFMTLRSQVICETQESTSAGQIFVFGSHTCVPLSWQRKKQSAVEHSSAETVSG